MKQHIFFYITTIFIITIITSLSLISNNLSYNSDIINSPTPSINEEIKKIEVEEPKDLFADYYDEAEKILSTLTIEEKLSQMFITNYIYASSDYNSVGGFILSSSSIKGRTKEALISELKARQENAKINYIMTIDEEGGPVTRLSYNPNIVSEWILSPRDLYADGGLDKVLEVEDYKDSLLLELGFNLNLAPVADIATDPNNFMYLRSIGLNPTETGNFVVQVTKKAQEHNLSTCLKHFPGYGPDGDTHRIETIDNRELSYLKENDLIPFQMGIEAGTPFILVSHNIITSIDSNYPASISKTVIDMLKNDYHYTGLIVSDDLSMGALNKYNSNNELSTLAINAGNDLLITNQYKKHYESALNSVKEGRISEERINESVKKIIAWKLAYNIIK